MASQLEVEIISARYCSVLLDSRRRNEHVCLSSNEAGCCTSTASTDNFIVVQGNKRLV